MSQFNKIRLASCAVCLLVLNAIGCSKGGYTSKIQGAFSPASLTIVSQQVAQKDGQTAAAGVRVYSFSDGAQDVKISVAAGPVGQNKVKAGLSEYQVTDACTGGSDESKSCDEIVAAITRSTGEKSEAVTFLLKPAANGQMSVTCSIPKIFDSVESARNALSEKCAQPKPVDPPAEQKDAK